MTSTTLKLIALVLMLCDHIHQFIGGAPIWLTWLGRISAPLFFFCTIWGIYYTHNRKKYLLHMYLWGIGMGIGDFVLSVLVPNPHSLPVNNVFVTLLLVGIIVSIIELYQNGEKTLFWKLFFAFIAMQIVSTILCFFSLRYAQFPMLQGIPGSILPNLLFCEGSIVFVAMGVTLYFTRNNKVKMSLWFFAFCLIFIPFGALSTMLSKNYQWMMVFALPLMLLYNGKKGKGMKWLFYIFYPAHVFLLCWLGSFVSF